MALAPISPYGAAQGRKWYSDIVDNWAAKGTFNAVGWLGDVLNRLNVSKNSLLLGDFENAFLSLVPFGETMGLDIEKVTGAKVFKEWGISPGAKIDIPLIGRKSMRDIMGFAILDVLGDPLMWLGGPGLTSKGWKAQQKMLKALGKLDIADPAALQLAQKILPVEWGAQAARGQMAALRFGITAKTSVPLVRGQRMLGELQKAGQWIKASKTGQLFTRGYPNPAIERIARRTKLKNLSMVEDMRTAQAQLDPFFYRLPPAERHLVAEAMELMPEIDRALPGLEKYPKHIQELAKRGRALADTIEGAGNAAKVPMGELGDPLRREVAAFAKKTTAVEKIGAAQQRIYQKQVEPFMNVLDYRIKEMQGGVAPAAVIVPKAMVPKVSKGREMLEALFGPRLKALAGPAEAAAKEPATAVAKASSDQIGELLSLQRSLQEFAVAPTKAMQNIRSIASRHLAAPEKVLQPKVFRQMLAKMGVKVPAKWATGRASFGRALYAMTQAEQAQTALASSTEWFNLLKAGEKAIPGYAPRMLTREARRAMAEVRELFPKIRTDFVTDSVAKYNKWFAGFGKPRVVKEISEELPLDDWALAVAGREWLEAGRPLRFTEIYPKIIAAGKEMDKTRVLKRTAAFGEKMKKGYGWLEQMADTLVTGKTRVIPRIYEVETDVAKGLGRMADNMIEQIFHKDFSELAMQMGDFVKAADDVPIGQIWHDSRYLAKTLKGKAVHPHLHMELRKITERFSDPKVMGKLTGFLSDLTNIWKRSILGPFVSYQTRNFFSDGVIDFFKTGNMDPTTHMRALKAYFNPNGSIRFGGKMTKVRDVLKYASSSDLGATYVKGEIMHSMKTTWLRAGEKLFGDTQLARHLRRFNPLSQDFFITAMGRTRDEVHRLASFIHGVDDGLDFVTAAMQTKAAFFDYSWKGLTAFERETLKPIFPFYTWASNAFKLQTKWLFQKPYKIALQLKGTPDLREAELKEEMALLPPGIREGLTFFGGKRGDVYTFIKGIGLPIEDAAQLLSWDNGMNRTLLKMFSRTSPILKLPLEWMFDTNTYFGTKISDYDRSYSILRHAPEPIKKYLGFKETKTKKGMRWRMDPWKVWILGQMRAFTLAGRVLESIDDPTQRKRTEAFLWAATGIRPMRYDIEQLRMRGERALTERLTEEMRRRGEIGVVQVPYLRDKEGASEEARAVMELFRQRRRKR